MNIEIHKPELEALILQQMQNGAFRSIEDVLLHALTLASVSAPSNDHPPRDLSRPLPNPGRKSLAQLFAESPFKGLELEFPRDKNPLRPVDF